VLIRRETDRDTDVIRAVTTAAFARGRSPGQLPPEARLIDELRAGPAWLPALSLVAVTPAGEAIGHVLGTRGHVGQHPVIALGPLAVRPDRQQNGVGSALMHAVYQIVPPEPQWQPHFQVRVLSAYHPRLRGTFTYPEPFDRT